MAMGSQHFQPQAVYFQKPFISKINDQFSLNVIGSNGQMYQFVTDAAGSVPSEPHIIAVDKNGDPIYQSLDTWSFVPTMWSALKKSIEDIEVLKTEVDTLKEEIGVLKNN